MTRNVTQEDLIKFVYGELTFQETADLYDKIDQQPEMIEDLETYAALKFQLNKAIISPPESILTNALEFSLNYSHSDE